MFFAGGSCWPTTGTKIAAARIELVCSNVSRLVHMAQTGECRYMGVFETPAVCTEDDVKAIEAAQLEDLGEIAWQRGIVLE
jgi:hypothetical protein